MGGICIGMDCLFFGFDGVNDNFSIDVLKLTLVQYLIIQMFSCCFFFFSFFSFFLFLVLLFPAGADNASSVSLGPPDS